MENKNKTKQNAFLNPMDLFIDVNMKNIDQSQLLSVY
jgi:hypothetical protein